MLSLRENIGSPKERNNNGSPLNLKSSQVVFLIPSKAYANENKGRIMGYINNNFKNSEVYFLTSESSKDISDKQLISFESFNIIGKPKDIVAEIINKKYDLLLSLIEEPDLFDRYIINMIPANYMAGIHHSENLSLFDITIEKKTDDLVDLIKEFEHYINSLNINK